MTAKAHLVIKVLAASCLLLMLVLVMCEALAEQPVETRTVSAHGGLNVRREPTTESRVVYVLEETTVVVILEWENGWALVASNHPPHLPIGWACGEYLK